MSALIFVALAVAWAVYLIPLALRSHEEDASSRNVEGFSDRLRVLARREPVSSKEAALVTADGVDVSGEGGAPESAQPVEPLESDVVVEPVEPALAPAPQPVAA